MYKAASLGDVSVALNTSYSAWYRAYLLSFSLSYFRALSCGVLASLYTTLKMASRIFRIPLVFGVKECRIKRYVETSLFSNHKYFIRYIMFFKNHCITMYVGFDRSSSVYDYLVYDRIIAWVRVVYIEILLYKICDLIHHSSHLMYPKSSKVHIIFVLQL